MAKDEAEAVGSLLDDDGFGESIGDIKARRYREQGGRGYEGGVIGMGVGDELEGRAFDDAEFMKAFDRVGTRRLDPRVRSAKQQAMRDGNWSEVAMQGSGLREGDAGPQARSRPIVLDGADPDTERAHVLAELEEAEARLAAFIDAQESPSPPAPVAPAAPAEPVSAAVGSAGDSLEDLAALERELGLGSSKDGHARVTCEQAPQETIPHDEDDEAMSEISDAYMPPPKSVNHISPACVKRIVDLVWPEGVDLDPFASRSEYTTIEATVLFFGPDDPDDPLDGLVEDWDLFASEQPTRAYVNSPYGRFIPKACTKIVEEVSSADVRTIALLKSCTDTGWFHEYVAATATAVCFVRGRLHYIDGDTGKTGPAPFPSILILWDDDRFGAFKHACEVYVDEDRKHPLGHVEDLRVGRDLEVGQTDSVPS